jgi:hypothetical protein
MLRLILVTIAIAAALTGREISRNADPAENVNSRYTVESVELLGYAKSQLSRTVRDRIDKMVGTKYDTSALTGLVWKIREEVRAKHINVRVGRGLQPEHLAVRLEVEGRRDKSFDVTAPKFGYHSRQGFSGSLEGVINAGSHLRLAGGYSNDADLLLERFQGFHGRAEVRLGNSPVTMKFRYASLGQTWNPVVIDSAGTRRYGNREIFEPTAMVNLARGLSWTAGVSIQRLSSPGSTAVSNTPNMAAPQTEASNAVVNTLRYRRRLEGTGAHQQELEAGYDLRAATQVLSSDYKYNKHTVDAGYTFVAGKQELHLVALAGFLNGTAPLYDRYILGNAQTLRGYNKFDLAPMGARRIVHGSVDYRWRLLQVFYDTGAISEVNSASMSEVKHSLGCGLRKDNIQLAVAFPLRGARMDPVFLVGVNF